MLGDTKRAAFPFSILQCRVQFFLVLLLNIFLQQQNKEILENGILGFFTRKKVFLPLLARSCACAEAKFRCSFLVEAQRQHVHNSCKEHYLNGIKNKRKNFFLAKAVDNASRRR